MRSINVLEISHAVTQKSSGVRMLIVRVVGRVQSTSAAPAVTGARCLCPTCWLQSPRARERETLLANGTHCVSRCHDHQCWRTLNLQRLPGAIPSMSDFKAQEHVKRCYARMTCMCSWTPSRRCCSGHLPPRRLVLTDGPRRLTSRESAEVTRGTRRHEAARRSRTSSCPFQP